MAARLSRLQERRQHLLERIEHMAGDAMSENKGGPTPGPWHVHESFRADKVSVLADVDLPHGRRAVTRTVAECGYPGAETNANAELIAQAPETKAQRDELLAAAEEALNVLIGNVQPAGGVDEGTNGIRSRNREHIFEAQASLRAAIRRAQGGGDE